MSAVAHIHQYKTGLFYTDDFRAASSWNGYEHNVLLRNEGTDAEGNLQFSDVAMAVGADEIKDSRGVSTADIDNDGDLDIVISNSAGDIALDHPITPTLYRNNIGNQHNWLAIELQGTESNRDGIGALVTIESNGVTQTGLVAAGSSYASQQGIRLYFGLADAARVEALTVHWPRQHIDRFEDVEGMQLVRITEGQGMEAMPLPNNKSAPRLSAK